MSLTYSTQQTIGWNAPDFSLTGTDGKQHTLQEYTDKKGLLIVFTCNHCPYARAAWPSLKKLHKKYKDAVEFVAINSNDAETYPEDNFEAMLEFAQENELPFAYLHDETQEIAKAYDAQCTPDIYLFTIENQMPKLFYRGRIHDNWKHPEKATEHNLQNALEKLKNGEKPPTNQPPSMGCNIKWK